MDVFNLPIEALGLTARSQNALSRAGLQTAGQLMNITEEELYSIRNLGKKSIDDILKKVHSLRNMKENEAGSLQDGNSAFSGVTDAAENNPNFAVWIQDAKHQQLLADYLKTANIKISHWSL